MYKYVSAGALGYAALSAAFAQSAPAAPSRQDCEMAFRAQALRVSSQYRALEAAVAAKRAATKAIGGLDAEAAGFTPADLELLRPLDMDLTAYGRGSAKELAGKIMDSMDGIERRKADSSAQKRQLAQAWLKIESEGARLDIQSQIAGIEASEPAFEAARDFKSARLVFLGCLSKAAP
jgi:hypothetical protein